MAKFTIEVELDWMDEESYNIDEEIKQEVIHGVKNELLRKASADAVKLVDKEIEQAVEKSKEEIAAKVDEFIEMVCAERIEKIMMPIKENSWSDKVNYIPMSEFIGQRYERFLNEKRLDKNGREATYSSDKQYSINEYLINKYLDKELTAKVTEMIKNARAEAEETVFKSLEQNLKENLAAETIERMNIPQILKNMQMQKEKYEQIGDK